MIAVCNTTPLRYLIAIELDDLLGRLFERVLAPMAVRDELTDSRTPEGVRRWMSSPPAWLEIRVVDRADDAIFATSLH
jgi:predicted nucleic acid-binding protein